MNSEETLDSILENTTSIIPSYEILTKGNWLAEIPIIQNNRSAPGIRNISLEGQTDHGEALRNVLTYDAIDDKVREAFKQGEFRFNIANGFHGNGFESLDKPTKIFLKRWETGYLPTYREYRHNLDQHDEIKNYRHVMVGALRGVTFGAFAGAGIDGLSCLLDSHGVYWEIGARALPAILEAEEIARPFARRGREWTKYMIGKSVQKPKPLTPTEIWSLTQLAGPFIGFGMLIVGEQTGLNQNPLYKATAVFTVNTGNNVIGGGSSYIHFLREIRKIRKEYDPILYSSYRAVHGNPLNKAFSYAKNALLTMSSKQRIQDLLVDFYLANTDFLEDSFQSSNVMVASSWYGAEVVLRYLGIAAENAQIGGCFGGKTLAAVESGLLSCDTAVAAKVAIEREKLKLHSEVRKLTDRGYLMSLYAA